MSSAMTTPLQTTSERDLKAVDQLRARLGQLSNMLASLRRDLEIADPLPSWHNIHNSVSLLSGLLGTTVTPLSSRRGADDTLARLASSAHIYPLPLHAGAIEREPVLGQLLRKKQEPDVEAWVQRAAAFVKKDGSTDQRTGDDGKGVPPSVAQLEELWQGAVGRAGELAQELPWGSAFTKRERDGQDGVAGVRTGLRRDLAAMEASEQDGEGEDEEEEDGVDDEDVIMD